MSNNYFICGTDTDAGKTVATATLFTYFQSKKNSVISMKPLQTGVSSHIEGPAAYPDIQALQQLTGVSFKQEELAQQVPQAFTKASSPHLAARLENRSIQIETVLQSYNTLCQKYDRVLVEGIGGLMVPITLQYSVLDLVKELAIPVIVTARTGLGTINHTLLTVEVLRHHNIPIKGILFSDTTAISDTEIRNDNIATIEEITGLPILGTIPFIDNISKITSKEFIQTVEHLYPSFDKSNL